MTLQEPNEANDKIRDLRKWCHANVKTPWSTYHIHGIKHPDSDARVGFVAFKFDNEQEAMKFQLWMSK